MIFLFTNLLHLALLCLAALAGYAFAMQRSRNEALQTEQSRQQALLRTQKQLLQLAEIHADLLWIKNTAGVYTSCNGAWAGHLGLPFKAIIGATDATLLDPATAASLRTYAQACLQDAAQPPLDLWLTSASDGKARLFEITKTPIWDEVGVLGGVQTVARDITVYREQEKRLQAANSRLELLELCVSHMNDVVLITEAEPINAPGPRVVYVNPAFERMTGYSSAEIIGKTARILQGPNSQKHELARIRASLEKWQGVRAELINYTKSGQEFWVELDISPVANPTGYFTHWVAVQRDITARKKEAD